MEQRGIVTEEHGDTVTVQVARSSSCGGECGQDCASCNVAGKKTVLICAKNQADAHKGDTVVLESSSKRVLFYAFLVYLLPIAAAVAGYYLGQTFQFAEGGRIACAAILFFAAFIPALLANRRAERIGSTVTATRIVTGGNL